MSVGSSSELGSSVWGVFSNQCSQSAWSRPVNGNMGLVCLERKEASVVIFPLTYLGPLPVIHFSCAWFTYCDI